jgi:hypothetical protein
MVKSVESSELGRDGMAACQRQGLAKISSAYVILPSTDPDATRRDKIDNIRSRCSRIMLAYLAPEPLKMGTWISGMRDPYVRRRSRHRSIDGELNAGRHAALSGGSPLFLLSLARLIWVIFPAPCACCLLFSFHPHTTLVDARWRNRYHV